MAFEVHQSSKPFIMTDERKYNPEPDGRGDQPASKPDPETLHTPDPQKKMEGPVSSLMHNAGEAFDTSETEAESNEEKDKAREV